MVFLLAFMILAAFAASALEDILGAVIALSVFGVLMAIAFSILQAPDVALTQAVINSGLVTSLFLVAYSQTRKESPAGREGAPAREGLRPAWIQPLALVLCITLGGVLWRGLASLGLPVSVSGPAAHFLEASGRETGAANVVAAILFDYRGFDTLGEATVIFATVCGIALLFSKSKMHRSQRGLSFIARRGMALIVPFILLYGSSIVAFGHLTPGGGFQGGAIFATVTILFCIVFGSDFETARVSPRVKEFMESGGALLFVLLGLAGLLTGAGFLANRAAGFPTGSAGRFLSGGTIPILNVAVALKVGAGLSTIFYSMIKVLEAEEPRRGKGGNLQ